MLSLCVVIDRLETWTVYEDNKKDKNLRSLDLISVEVIVKFHQIVGLRRFR